MSSLSPFALAGSLAIKKTIEGQCFRFSKFKLQSDLQIHV